MADTSEPAVRAYAEWTATAARILGCSYADAAIFVLKLSTMIPLIRDVTFQDQLARWTKHSAARQSPMEPESLPDKMVH